MKMGLQYLLMDEGVEVLEHTENLGEDNVVSHDIVIKELPMMED